MSSAWGSGFGLPVFADIRRVNSGRARPWRLQAILKQIIARQTGTGVDNPDKGGIGAVSTLEFNEGDLPRVHAGADNFFFFRENLQ